MARAAKFQLVGQCFFDRVRERDHIVVAQIAFDDMPLLVDEEGGRGQADIAIDLGNLALRINDDREGQFAGLGVVLDIVGWVVFHGYKDRLIALGCEFIVDFDHAGHLLDAGQAAGRPEVDQHDFAAQIGGGNFLSSQRDECDVGGHLGRTRELPQAHTRQSCERDQSDYDFFHLITTALIRK